MAVSFYRLGVTPRLMSYGTRKFERGVSEEPDDIMLLSLASLFFSRHIILPPSIASLQRLLSVLAHFWLCSDGGL